MYPYFYNILNTANDIATLDGTLWTVLYSKALTIRNEDGEHGMPSLFCTHVSLVYCSSYSAQTNHEILLLEYCAVCSL